jgi:hypothetical protein
VTKVVGVFVRFRCAASPETLFSHGEMPDESEEKTLKQMILRLLKTI